MRAANSDLGERTFETLRLKFSKGWSAVVSDVNASVLNANVNASVLKNFGGATLAAAGPSKLPSTTRSTSAATASPPGPPPHGLPREASRRVHKDGGKQRPSGAGPYWVTGKGE